MPDASDEIATESIRIQSPPAGSEANERWLDAHLAEIRRKVISRADQINDSEGDGTGTQASSIAQAAMEFAPGERFPDQISWARQIGSQMSAVTVIASVLAAVFGGIAYLSTTGENAQPQEAARYLDIAKFLRAPSLAPPEQPS